jgi:prophage regulatory protein
MVTAHTAPPQRLIRLRQVMARTGLSRSTIYEHISQGKFPKQISLGPQSVGWVEGEIDGWINSRIQASRQAS